MMFPIQCRDALLFSSADHAANGVHVGALAMVLLVVGLVALSMLILVVVMMNQRRRSARTSESRAAERPLPDPWKTAGERLSTPDEAPPGDRTR